MLLGGFALGDDFAIFGGALLHVGDLDHDALVLGGFVYGALHLEVSLVDAFGGLGGICFGCRGD